MRLQDKDERDGTLKRQKTKTDRQNSRFMCFLLEHEQKLCKIDYYERDVAQIQAQVVILYETWKTPGVAEEVCWRSIRAENVAKATVAVMGGLFGLLRRSRANVRWAMVVFASILFFSMYLLNTRCAVEALGEYGDTLSAIDNDFCRVRICLLERQRVFIVSLAWLAGTWREGLSVTSWGG